MKNTKKSLKSILISTPIITILLFFMNCLFPKNTNAQSATCTYTAIGCIPTTDFNEFAKWLIGKFIFIASGIAFLLMVFAAFQIITSAGNSEKIQTGKEMITSTISGLLFIILSAFLLKLIGVDILQIPGFGR